MEITINKVNDHSLIELINNCGMRITLTSLGAGIRSVKVPDKDGVSRTVTVCPVDEEVNRPDFYGKTIGRTSGRIAGATFEIDGKTAVLEKNNKGVDNLHGGSTGFHSKVFGFGIKEEKEYSDVVFAYDSPDGEGGYFGNVSLKVTYRIFNGKNAFRIIFDGTADEKCLLNLTNHVYWNMSGDLRDTVKEQTLFLNADRYGKLNERLIVEETVAVNKHMDFRKPHKIGDYAEEADVQLYTYGYDHPFFFEKYGMDTVTCSLKSDRSGILLEMSTTYPCVVLYTDNLADVNVEVYPGKKNAKYLAACLECQYHPDGIHQSPDNCGILDGCNPYHEEIEYTFSVCGK